MNEWSQILDMMYVEMFPVPPQLFMFLYAKLNVQMNLLIMLALGGAAIYFKTPKSLMIWYVHSNVVPLSQKYIYDKCSINHIAIFIYILV